jgi:hypothetical protein
MTTYVDHVLEPSETVRYRTTVSWIVYVPSLLLAFMAAMLGGHPQLSGHDRQPPNFRTPP